MVMSHLILRRQRVNIINSVCGFVSVVVQGTVQLYQYAANFVFGPFLSQLGPLCFNCPTSQLPSPQNGVSYKIYQLVLKFANAISILDSLLVLRTTP